MDGGGAACVASAAAAARGAPDAAACGAGLEGGEVSCEDLASRLRELLLAFPTGVLEGVHWSALCKAYADRFVKPKGDGAVGARAGLAPPTAEELLAARACLADVAMFEEGAGGLGDGRLRVLDSVALEPNLRGRLTCWPLLAKKLSEIVQSQGTPMAIASLRLPSGDEGDLKVALTDGVLGAHACLPDDAEVVGVLLAQLKPLLRRHWDPTFEERNLSFFKADGGSVSTKKMKHLIEWLVKWCARRRQLAAAGAPPSAIDHAIAGPPLALANSQRHNDMVLCCLRSVRLAELAPPQVKAAQYAPPTVGPASPSLRAGPALGSAAPSQPVGAGSGACGAEAGSSPQRADSQRVDVLEKENRRLRIESAELKKRLRFDKEFLNKEIRRLRIENAELKKRVFFPNPYSSGHMTPPHLPLQPVWVSAAPAVLAVSGPVPVPAAAGTSPEDMQSMSAGTGCGVVASGQVSPPLQGAVTPVQQTFCYAVPLAQGVMSPMGAPWQTVGPVMQAVPIGDAHVGGSGPSSAISPFSDASQQERLLPRRFCGSDPNSSHGSLVPDSLQPESRSDAEQLAPSLRASEHPASSSRVGPHERWVCIPSGFVERRRKEFEGRAGGDSAPEVPPTAPGGAAADAVAEVAMGGTEACETVPASAADGCSAHVDGNHAPPTVERKRSISL